MDEILYLVSFEYENNFNINSGNCAVYIKKGNYAESEVLELFVENVRTNFNLEKD